MSNQHRVHLKASILNPGPNITALKFPGWIRNQVKDIDIQAKVASVEYHHSIIMLYVTEKLFHQFGSAKLDKLLQALTNSYETVMRIELRVVEAQLDEAQLAQVSADLKAWLDEMGNKSG